MPGDTLKQGLGDTLQIKKQPLRNVLNHWKHKHSGHSKKKQNQKPYGYPFKNVGKTKVSEQPGRYVPVEWLCGPLRRARRSQWHTAKTNGKTTIPVLWRVAFDWMPECC